MDDLSVVKRLYGGMFISSVADELRRMALMALAARKPGAITAKVEVLPMGIDAEDREIKFRVSFSRTLPKGKTREMNLFLDKNGALLQDDPRQVPMEFRIVEDAPPEVRDTDGPAPSVREA